MSHSRRSPHAPRSSHDRTYLAASLRERFEPIPELASGDPASCGVPSELWDRALLDPVDDFLNRPGKELRARLVEIAYALGGGVPGACPPSISYLVEMLHAGSLIVDDIEDGSEHRRGAPALHRTHGVPLALNAGNWLYFWPMVELAKADLSPRIMLEIYRCTSVALLRCHQGQALDLGARSFELKQEELEHVARATTRLKTGSLMELAAVLGALVAGAGEARVRLIGQLGRDLGMGLQMLDDLGGITCEERREKGDEDLRQGRVVWPFAWFAQRSEPFVFLRAQHEARRVFDGADPSGLRSQLADGSELHGKRQVRECLDAAFEGILRELGPVAPLRDLKSEIDRLRRSYG